MPLIDVQCQNAACGQIAEVYRPLAEWPKTPACPTCGGSTVQAFLPKAVTWTADPVVVFQAPDGTFRFPGEADGAATRRYEALGYTRIDVRNAVEMRRLERRVSAHDRSVMARRAEAKQANREAREAQTRSILRQQMARMSPFGRAVARAAMAQNDAKPRERGGDPGFHSEAYAYDRSNREASRDGSGRRRRD